MRCERLRASAGGTWLHQEICGKEGVLKSMSAKDDLVASGELVDAVEDLIPGVLRHQAYECVQTDDGLIVEMVKNSSRDSISTIRRLDSWI